MRGLGSGISNIVSTIMPLVLYEVAGLVRMQRLRSEGYELTQCHMHRPQCSRDHRISTFACAPAWQLRTVPVGRVSRSHPIYPIPILSSLKLHSWLTSYTSIRDGHRPPADAAREGSERSHLNPCVRHSPGSSCCTSGNIVESIPKDPVSSHVAS
jgi:hypothetical protein